MSAVDRLAELGVTAIADLGCGLGFEAASFVAAGMRVIAVERDVESMLFASHNLAAAGVPVRQFDVVADMAALAAVLTEVDAVFVDPARRDPAAARDLLGNTARIAVPTDWSPKIGRAHV